MSKSSTTDRVRRVVAVALVLGLFAAAVAYFVSVPGGAEVAGPANTPTTAETSPTPGSSPSSADPDADPNADPNADPSSTEPGLTGPGRDQPGVALVASPREDGTWDVVEYVRLARAATELDLSRARVSAAGGAFAELRSRARDLQATAGGELAAVSNDDGRRVEAAARTREFELRYVLDGATVRSVPSKAGRALTALAPIADPGPDADAVQIVVNSAAVRTVSCPLLEGDAQVCATGQSPRWAVRPTLTRATAVALIQFDLPKPQ